jgi:CDP-glucose 4,6-dehydratase
MRSAFWQGRRIFLTGHTGFKGGWLALWLQRHGAEVTGYALPPATQPNLFEAARVADGMRSDFGDVRDASTLTRALRRSSAEVVIHMAAQALVRASYDDPTATYGTNVMGAVHLLEAARDIRGLRAVVVVTSDKCYENREWPWGYRETDELGGRDPYSSSKACAELVTAAYRESFFSARRYASHGVAVATARAGNVIGGGDWSPDRLVPDAIRAFTTDTTLVVRHAEAVRPWQHVLEPLHGYLTLAERLYEDGPGAGCAWNFGPRDDDAKPVGALVERLAQLWGTEASWRTAPPDGDSPPEAGWLRLDCSQARTSLGWTPMWNLERGLTATVDWHRRLQRGGSARELCSQQIEIYETERELFAASPRVLVSRKGK